MGRRLPVFNARQKKRPMKRRKCASRRAGVAWSVRARRDLTIPPYLFAERPGVGSAPGMIHRLDESRARNRRESRQTIDRAPPPAGSRRDRGAGHSREQRAPLACCGNGIGDAPDAGICDRSRGENDARDNFPQSLRGGAGAHLAC